MTLVQSPRSDLASGRRTQYPHRGFDQYGDDFLSAGHLYDGQSDHETGREWDETQHPVTLTNGFYLGKYEVTGTVSNGDEWKHEGLSRQVLSKTTAQWKSFLGGCSNLSHSTQCHRADRGSIAQQLEICPAYGGRDVSAERERPGVLVEMINSSVPL